MAVIGEGCALAVCGPLEANLLWSCSLFCFLVFFSSLQIWYRDFATAASRKKRNKAAHTTHGNPFFRRGGSFLNNQWFPPLPGEETFTIFDRVFYQFEDLDTSWFEHVAAIINHILVCQNAPPWILPQFLRFNSLNAMSAEGRRKWVDRMLKDRSKVLWDCLERDMNFLLNCLGDRTRDRSRTMRHTFRFGSLLPPEGPISRLFLAIQRRWFPDHDRLHPRWLFPALFFFTRKKLERTQLRWGRVLTSSLEANLQQLHPAMRILMISFLEESRRFSLERKNDCSPLNRLLTRGAGFIPTPSWSDFCKAMITQSVKNAGLHSFHPKHPGIDSPTAQLYFERLKNLIWKVRLKDNLPHDERKALKEAIRNGDEFVFVQTDKTGRFIRIKRKSIAKAIGNFIRKQQGRSFDIIADEISLANQLQEMKRKLQGGLGTFIEEFRALSPHGNWEKGPFLVRGKFFRKGTSALEKMITVLASEIHFLPAFGPLKPLIKDHKISGDIMKFIEENEDREDFSLPIRLTHKATEGPTAGLAEIIGPILECLAALCCLALCQASSDVAFFLRKFRFSKKPAIAAIDVENAFWAMRKKMCLERVATLARRFPEVLESFGITVRGLVVALDLIWEDNFFIALSQFGPLFGRVLGCTMGNVISMPSCRIYYFSSIDEALDRVGRWKFIYCKSGGDDALLLAWETEDIDLLHATLNDLDDGWTYELRKPSVGGHLPFFDVDIWAHERHDATWEFATGIFFKEADLLRRTNANAFWSWDHAEALLRAHLDRTAKICSDVETATTALRKLGRMMARREHPLQALILSCARLNPLFLAEASCPERTLLSPGNTPPLPQYATWTEPDKQECIHLSAVIPYGAHVNEAAKRITGEFMEALKTLLYNDEKRQVKINVNNTPFKSLARLLPVAKICPPPKLLNNLVYRISNATSPWCGIGQVGTRPLAHRLIEHARDIRGGRGPYVGKGLDPERDAKVIGCEADKSQRLAREAVEILLSNNCCTTESINLGPWKALVERLKPLRGGAREGELAGRGYRFGVRLPNPPQWRWNVPLAASSPFLSKWENEYMFLPHNTQCQGIMAEATGGPFEWKRVSFCCGKCTRIVDFNSRTDTPIICDVCRRGFHGNCWTRNERNRLPDLWSLNVCVNCGLIAKEIAEQGCLVTFIETPGLPPRVRNARQRLPTVEGSVDINAKECGPLLSRLLLDAFAQPGVPSETSRTELFRHGLPGVGYGLSAGITPPDTSANSKYPLSIFVGAADMFWEIFLKQSRYIFVELAPGLLQQLVIASSLSRNAPWCSCQVPTVRAFRHACFLHFVFFGEPYMGFHLNMRKLEVDVNQCTRERRNPLLLPYLMRRPTTGRDNKCFFAALSAALFDSECWASILKARCVLWIRSLSMSETIIGAWTEGRSSEAERTQACIWNIARMAGGMLQGQDIAVALAWAFVELWVDVAIVSNEIDTIDIQTGIISGRKVIQESESSHLLRTFWNNCGHELDFHHLELPVFPQVLLAHEGAHFEALRWGPLLEADIVSPCLEYSEDIMRTRREAFAPVLLTFICDDFKKSLLCENGRTTGNPPLPLLDGQRFLPIDSVPSYTVEPQSLGPASATPGHAASPVPLGLQCQPPPPLPHAETRAANLSSSLVPSCVTRTEETPFIPLPQDRPLVRTSPQATPGQPQLSARQRCMMRALSHLDCNGRIRLCMQEPVLLIFPGTRCHL